MATAPEASLRKVRANLETGGNPNGGGGGTPAGTPARMTAKDIERVLRRLGDLYIPEFTYEDLRIDAILINIRDRKVRGFEIKADRGDFLQDKKWQLYSKFCSSLSVACPEGLIQPEEVSDPFGLVWIKPNGDVAWTWTYLSVIEKEIVRLVIENDAFKLAEKTREMKR